MWTSVPIKFLVGANALDIIDMRSMVSALLVAVILPLAELMEFATTA